MKAATLTPLKTLPWGEEIYTELPIHAKKATNKFYARHGKTPEGRHYLEFYKFGTKPNTEGERYIQKFKLFDAMQWLKIQEAVESQLLPSIGWDLADAKARLDAQIATEEEEEK